MSGVPSFELRACRLWHWKKFLSAERRAARERKGFPKSRLAEARAVQLDKEAGKHLRFVQALNDCFPAGDYAAADLELHLSNRGNGTNPP